MQMIVVPNDREYSVDCWTVTSDRTMVRYFDIILLYYNCCSSLVVSNVRLKPKVPGSGPAATNVQR